MPKVTKKQQKELDWRLEQKLDAAARRSHLPPSKRPMLIEIVGDNQSFFRRISQKHWKVMVASVPWNGCQVSDLDRLHKLVWDWSKPAKVSSTGDVEATVIDDTNDTDSCLQSWDENHEALVDECKHKDPHDVNGHLFCHDCGGMDV